MHLVCQGHSPILLYWLVMDLLILGFPQSGKTSLFSALTHRQVAAGGYSGGTSNGVAKVPDERLATLTAMFKPQKVTPAEIQYIDTPAMGGGRKNTSALSGELLNLMQGADALVHVVRAFDNPAVPVADGAATPEEAIVGMDLELAMVDLGILERRIDRLTSSLRGAKATERAGIEKELELVNRVHDALESEIPVYKQEISKEGRLVLANFNLITAKPMMVVLNVGEDEVANTAKLEAEWRDKLTAQGRVVVALCAELEMELAELSNEDEAEFRGSLGIEEPGRDHVARASYDLLGLISFLTAGPDEVRAWTITKETPAQKAAGKIHSDIERGFIRAEVVTYDDLIAAGSLAEAKKVGKFRLEGKTYPMQDGDVVNFLFSV
jgi:GTP-binding protein YchF